MNNKDLETIRTKARGIPQAHEIARLFDHIASLDAENTQLRSALKQAAAGLATLSRHTEGDVSKMAREWFREAQGAIAAATGEGAE